MKRLVPIDFDDLQAWLIADDYGELLCVTAFIRNDEIEAAGGRLIAVDEWKCAQSDEGAVGKRRQIDRDVFFALRQRQHDIDALAGGGQYLGEREKIDGVTLRTEVMRDECRQDDQEERGGGKDEFWVGDVVLFEGL